MAIHFDKLPDSLTPSLIEAGRYKVRVDKAEMRTPKDDSKPAYLSLQLKVFSPENKELGVVFDIITESASKYMQYKLYRFMTACDVNLGNEFELRDLSKVVAGKIIEADIVIDDKSEPKRNQVNMFSDCYWPLNATKSIDEFIPSNADDVPFDENASEPEAFSDDSY